MDCATPTFCAALLAPRSVVTYDGAKWSKLTHVPGDGYLSAISCPRRRHCLAIGGHQTATYDGNDWTAVSPTSNRWRYDKQAYLLALSCWSSKACTAVDQGGHTLTYDGSVWSAPLSVDRSGSFGQIPVSGTFVGLSCPETEWCRVASSTSVLGTGH
jgi:hypothetical protein